MIPRRPIGVRQEGGSPPCFLLVAWESYTVWLPAARLHTFLQPSGLGLIIVGGKYKKCKVQKNLLVFAELGTISPVCWKVPLLCPGTLFLYNYFVKMSIKEESLPKYSYGISAKHSILKSGLGHIHGHRHGLSMPVSVSRPSHTLQLFPSGNKFGSNG
jgi:hypothetical protein